MWTGFQDDLQEEQAFINPRIRVRFPQLSLPSVLNGFEQPTRLSKDKSLDIRDHSTV